MSNASVGEKKPMYFEYIPPKEKSVKEKFVQWLKAGLEILEQYLSPGPEETLFLSTGDLKPPYSGFSSQDTQVQSRVSPSEAALALLRVIYPRSLSASDVGYRLARAGDNTDFTKTLDSLEKDGFVQSVLIDGVKHYAERKNRISTEKNPTRQNTTEDLPKRDASSRSPVKGVSSKAFHQCLNYLRMQHVFPVSIEEFSLRVGICCTTVRMVFRYLLKLAVLRREKVPDLGKSQASFRYYPSLNFDTYLQEKLGSETAKKSGGSSKIKNSPNRPEQGMILEDTTPVDYLKIRPQAVSPQLYETVLQGIQDSEKLPLPLQSRSISQVLGVNEASLRKVLLFLVQAGVLKRVPLSNKEKRGRSSFWYFRGGPNYDTFFAKRAQMVAGEEVEPLILHPTTEKHGAAVRSRYGVRSRQAILDALAQAGKELTRAEIQVITNTNKATVHSVLKDLSREGLVHWTKVKPPGFAATYFRYRLAPKNGETQQEESQQQESQQEEDSSTQKAAAPLTEILKKFRLEKDQQQESQQQESQQQEGQQQEGQQEDSSTQKAAAPLTEILKKFRLEKGLSPGRLAKRLKIHHSSYKRWEEQGKYPKNPRAETRLRSTLATSRDPEILEWLQQG